MIGNRPLTDDPDPSAEEPGERAPVTRPSLPIVSHLRVRIGDDERRDLARRAGRLLADEPLLSATEPFGDAVEPGLGPWSALLLEDHSAISLYDPQLAAQYSYRALLLAGDDDLVAVAPPRCIEFERYCREVLGLGGAEVVSARTADATVSLTTACAKDPDMLERAVARGVLGEADLHWPEPALPFETGCHVRLRLATREALRSGRGRAHVPCATSIHSTRQRRRAVLAATLGAPEIILIIVVIVLLFGARKLPDLARAIGSSVRELQKGLKEGQSADEELSESGGKDAD